MNDTCQDIIRTIQKCLCYRDAIALSVSCKQLNDDIVVFQYGETVMRIQKMWKSYRAKIICRNILADRIFTEPRYRTNYVEFHDSHFCMERKFATSKWLQILYNNNIDNAIEQFSSDQRYERVVYELLQPGSSPQEMLHNSIYVTLENEDD